VSICAIICVRIGEPARKHGVDDADIWHHAVVIHAIIPGLIVTEETEQRFELHDPAVRHQREQAIPLQRLGQPDDIAKAVLLMLAPESRFITGQKIAVDGGQNMW
jgi:3-oxoacyl-[acyl-carrier protein] reductase